MAEGEKQDKQLKKRLEDLADKSFSQNMFTFSGFLSLAEQSVFHEMEQTLGYAHGKVFGGMEDSERVIIRFGDPAQLGYDQEFPIRVIRIKPLHQKFADDLTHRDFLGALMNLGIDRSVTGDILIADNCGYLFCMDTIADFIIANLVQVKHTTVICTQGEPDKDIPRPVQVEKELTVASERVDACTAKLYNLSRTSAIELFRAGRVYINGRQCENNSRDLKKGDVVTVRGFGKYFYDGVLRETKKGKLAVQVRVYADAGS